MSDKRAFRGVWIPAELWLDRTLTMQEKVMLVEIQSLSSDPERGCFKSNAAFAEFFGVSASRISQVLSALEQKGLIKVILKREGKQVVERNVFLTATYLEKLTPSLENLNTLFRKPKEGYLENCEESNTLLSNTVEKEVSSKPAPSKRGTRLPDDWTLPADYHTEALRVNPAVASRIFDIAEHFKDYWIAQPGQKGVKADWLATWRNWVRRERQGPAQYKTAAEKRAERAAATFDYDKATTF